MSHSPRRLLTGQSPQNGGRGLLNVREKSAFLRDRLSIQSAITEGTEVAAPNPWLDPCNGGGDLMNSETDLKTKGLLVDDHPLVLEGVRSSLLKHNHFEIVGEAVTGLEAINRAKEYSPDVVVMD